MTNDTVSAHSRRFTRWMRAAGWSLVGFGVVASWVWSAELTIVGEFVNVAIAGAATLLLFSAGTFLIWRVSPHRGRRATMAFQVVVIATAFGAIVAGIVPVASVAATTGTVTAEVTSGTRGTGYTVSDVAVITSDRYQQTVLDLTVMATDRTTPPLVATLSFTDGTTDVTCTNTRQTWTHDVSTVALTCDSFTPIDTLETVAAVTVLER